MYSYKVFHLFLFLSLLIGWGVTGSVWLCLWTWSFLVPQWARVNDHWPESSLPQVALLWTLNPDHKPPLTTLMDHSRLPGSVYTNDSDNNGPPHPDGFPAPTVFQLLWLLQEELTAVTEVLLIQHTWAHLCKETWWGVRRVLKGWEVLLITALICI